MIPIILSFIVAVTFLFKTNMPIDSKWVFTITLFCLTLVASNNITFALMHKKTNVKIAYIPHQLVKKGIDSLEIDNNKISLEHIIFLPSNKVTPRGYIKIEMPMVYRHIPKDKRLFFTLPGIWLNNKNKPRYYPHLGKIKVYTLTLSNK